MTSECELIRAEVDEIEHLLQEECCLEGKRRGIEVDLHDPTVQVRVADLILAGMGSEMRRRYAERI